MLATIADVQDLDQLRKEFDYSIKLAKRREPVNILRLFGRVRIWQRR